MKVRGNLPCTLEADGCHKLLAVPLALLEEFQQVADAMRRNATLTPDCPILAARSAAPADVRTFYRELYATRHADSQMTCWPLAAAPFPGLRSSVDAVLGALSFCTADLTPNRRTACELQNLPLLPLSSGDITILGARDGPRTIVNAVSNLLPGCGRIVCPPDPSPAPNQSFLP